MGFFSLYLISLVLLYNMSCYVNTTCGCMGQGVGYAASVTDDVQTFVTAFQVVVDFNFHIVEFNFHTIQKGIIVCSSRSDLIQGVDHFDDAV